MTTRNVEHEIAVFLENFDPHTEFFRTHYFNIISTIAANHPVIHSRAYNNGFSVVSKHALISQITNNASVFLNVPQARLVPSAPLPATLPVDANGLEHVFYRRLLNPYFSPARVAKLSVRVRQHIRKIVTAHLEENALDVVADLGQPVTGQITMDILGLPREAWHDFAEPIHNSAFCIGSLEERHQGYLGFTKRVKQEVARLVNDHHAGGLIADLGRSEVDGKKLTLPEIESIVSNIIIGGLDTTQAALSCATLYLARNPGRRRELLDHPERIGNAVNEFIRVFSPAPMTGRFTNQDIEVEGHRFTAGETVMMFWAAANYDPDFVENPFDVDFTRDQVRLVSFAMGPHRCLGLHLAKMELTAFLEILLEMAPAYRVVEERVTMPEDITGTLAYLSVPVNLH